MYGCGSSVFTLRVAEVICMQTERKLFFIFHFVSNTIPISQNSSFPPILNMEIWKTLLNRDYCGLDNFINCWSGNKFDHLHPATRETRARQVTGKNIQFKDILL